MDTAEASILSTGRGRRRTSLRDRRHQNTGVCASRRVRIREDGPRDSSMSQPSDQRDIQAQVRRILQEHRDGHFDQEKTAYLLERSISQQPQAVRHDIFETLWSALSTEPLSSPVQRGAFVPCVQAVVVRSIAEFGPTAELPERVFELLRRGDTPECTDFWARSICPSLTYFTFHNAARFPPETLDRAKKLAAHNWLATEVPHPFVKLSSFQSIVSQTQLSLLKRLALPHRSSPRTHMRRRNQ